MHRLFLFLLTACLPAVPALAAERFRLPSVGIIAGPDGLALVQGVPGAAMATPFVNVPGIEQLRVSPDGLLAAGIDARARRIALVRDAGPASPELIGHSADVLAFVFSPAGRSIAAQTNSGKVAVFTGLSSHPRLLWEYDVSALGAEARVVAASDDGIAVAVSVMRGDLAQLHLVTRSGVRPLDAAERLVSVVFLAGRRDLAGYDPDAGEVVVVRDRAASEAIARHRVSTGAVAALTGSQITNRILLAETSGVALLNTATGATEHIPCACRPTRLVRIGGDVYQLTGPESGEIWLFEDSKSPRTLILPQRGGARE